MEVASHRAAQRHPDATVGMPDLGLDDFDVREAAAAAHIDACAARPPPQPSNVDRSIAMFPLLVTVMPLALDRCESLIATFGVRSVALLTIFTAGFGPIRVSVVCSICTCM